MYFYGIFQILASLAKIWKVADCAVSCRKNRDMKAIASFFPLHEAHVRLHCNGLTLEVEDLPEQSVPEALPSGYLNGLCMIYHVLKQEFPSLESIRVAGIWYAGTQPLFCAFDLWVQTQEGGVYLPMETAALLFSHNGIPYFHRPPEW